MRQAGIQLRLAELSITRRSKTNRNFHGKALFYKNKHFVRDASHEAKRCSA